MKSFNFYFWYRIPALFLVFLFCVSCNGESEKSTQSKTRIEEFGDFAVEIPSYFYSRKDKINPENFVQTVEWQCDSRIRCTFELAIYHSVPSHLIDNETKKALVDMYANYIRKNADPTLRENEKTDSTLHFEYYENNLFHNYYFGIVEKENKMITYFYDGYSPFYKGVINEIINSICLWDSINYEYDNYKSSRLSYSINYPCEYDVKEIIDVDQNCISLFSCNTADSTKLPTLNYSVSRNKYYNNLLIDSLILKDRIIDESSNSMRWQMNKEKGSFYHREREAYRYKEFSLATGKQYIVCFIKADDEYYILKFGDSVESIIFYNSNKLSDIIASFQIL